MTPPESPPDQKSPLTPDQPIIKDVNYLTSNGLLVNNKAQLSLEQLRTNEKAYLEKRKPGTKIQHSRKRLNIPIEKTKQKNNFDLEATLIQKSNHILLEKKPIKQYIDYATARRALWRIMTNMLMVESRTFKENGNNLIIIKQLLKYFIHDPTCQLDLRKSIFIFGPSGVGKDFLFKAFKKLLDDLPDYHSFGLNPSIQVYESVKSRDKKLSKYFTHDICFQNLGNEPKLAYKTGEVPIFEHILPIRFNARTNLLRTHTTSNHRPDKLNLIYSNNIQNIAPQLWNFVFLNGISLR